MSINSEIIKLKNLISDYNQEYRMGKPTISDEEYDLLVDKLKLVSSAEEYVSFRSTLNESGGNVKHPYIMGSLEKVSYEKPEECEKWLTKNKIKKIYVTAKVDGLSCRLYYNNGKLISAATRGDGITGVDITDKVLLMPSVRKTISTLQPLHIRGEIVIYKNDFIRLNENNDNTFKNARNAAVGIINRKGEYSLVEYLTFVGYEVLNIDADKAEQINTIHYSTGLTTTTVYAYDYYKNGQAEAGEAGFLGYEMFVCFLTEVYSDLKNSEKYDIDGLVLNADTYRNENVYLPTLAVAFKVNNLLATTTILDISFEGPSKDGKFIPVAIIEPVELGGSTIGRVTCHNFSKILEANLEYGAKIVIQKSGDVIPYIKEILPMEGKNPDNRITAPELCPYCNTKLTFNGVDILCENKACCEQVNKQVEQFIKKLGVKNASLKTLKNFNITTYQDLLDFIPDSSISQRAFAKELTDNIFTKSYVDILSAFNSCDISNTTFNKIVEYYGLDRIKTFNSSTKTFDSYPSGVAETTMKKFCESISDNVLLADLVVGDARWVGPVDVPTKSAVPIIGTICFTGPLNSLGRHEATKKAEGAGFVVKNSVSKGLTYLVTNEASNTTKYMKAISLGILVINEERFLDLISNKLDNGLIDL